LRLIKDNKGQIRIIEAFFASILLLSALTLIPAAQNNSNDAYTSLSSTAQNLLLSLDSNGHLSTLINNENWIELKKSIQSSISPSTWFNLTVFDENMICINDTPICSGSVISNNIAAVNYVCASTNSDYTVYIIRLQLAQVA
jgi:hypothetical protein